jgi:hypothetical protein
MINALDTPSGATDAWLLFTFGDGIDRKVGSLRSWSINISINI